MHVDWAKPAEIDICRRYTGRWTAQSDAAGGFAVEDPTPDIDILFIRDPGYAPLLFLPGERASTPRDGTTFKIGLEPGSILTGTLKRGGKPQPDQKVSLSQSGSHGHGANLTISYDPLNTQTDAQGRFRFDSLAAGDYSITALDTTWRATLGKREGKELALEVEGPGKGVLTGRVLQGDEPLAGQHISLTRSGRQVVQDGQLVESSPSSNFQTTSAKDGTFRFEQLPAGDYTLHSTLMRTGSSDHPSAWIRNIAIADGEVTRDVVFGALHKVTMRLKFPEGTDLAGQDDYQSPELRPKDYTSPTNDEQLSDFSRGERRGDRLSFEGRFRGRYQLNLLHQTGDGQSERIVVPLPMTLNNLKGDQDLGTIELPDPGKSSLSGLVADLSGNPVAGAQVRVMRRDYSRSATTDNTGAYSIAALPEGDYDTQISREAEDGQPALERVLKVHVEGKTARDVVLLPVHTVTGRITALGADGNGRIDSIQYVQLVGLDGKPLGGGSPEMGPAKALAGDTGLQSGGTFRFLGRFQGRAALNVMIDNRKGDQAVFMLSVQLDNLDGDQDLGEVPLPTGVPVSVRLDWGDNQSPQRDQLDLILTPAEAPGARTVAQLKPDAGLQQPTNAAPGRYVASVFAYAWQSDPAKLEVEIKPDAPPTVVFAMHPTGTIVGAPDSSRIGGTDTHFTKLTLRGPLDGDIQTRVLTPTALSENEAFFTRQDFLRDRQFFLTGLEAGRYELTVETEGYKPWRTTTTVVPGLPDHIRVKLERPEE